MCDVEQANNGVGFLAARFCQAIAMFCCYYNYERKVTTSVLMIERIFFITNKQRKA
jgi:hypothetical protein